MDNHIGGRNQSRASRVVDGLFQAGHAWALPSDRELVALRYPGALSHPGCGRRVLRCRQAGVTATWHRRRGARLAAVTAKVAAGAVEPDKQCHSL